MVRQQYHVRLSIISTLPYTLRQKSTNVRAPHIVVFSLTIKIPSRPSFSSTRFFLVISSSLKAIYQGFIFNPPYGEFHRRHDSPGEFLILPKGWNIFLLRKLYYIYYVNLRIDVIFHEHIKNIQMFSL